MTGFEKEVIDRLARIETGLQDSITGREEMETRLSTRLTDLTANGCMPGATDRARIGAGEKAVADLWTEMGKIRNGRRKQVALAGSGIVIGAGAVAAVVEWLKGLLVK